MKKNIVSIVAILLGIMCFCSCNNNVESGSQVSVNSSASEAITSSDVSQSQSEPYAPVSITFNGEKKELTEEEFNEFMAEFEMREVIYNAAQKASSIADEVISLNLTFDDAYDQMKELEPYFEFDNLTTIESMAETYVSCIQTDFLLNDVQEIVNDKNDLDDILSLDTVDQKVKWYEKMLESVYANAESESSQLDSSSKVS